MQTILTLIRILQREQSKLNPAISVKYNEPSGNVTTIKLTKIHLIAKALARLHICTDLSEPSLLANGDKYPNQYCGHAFEYL